MKISLDSEEWEDLSNRSKRLCLHWFYACHVFNAKGETARELPKCLMQHIREAYPEDSGKYVGFKSTEERLDVKHKRALEEMDVNSKLHKTIKKEV